ncbi:hypothetical protein O970_01505 [Candidatus Schmidhempelia bombi str. Bimp]|uniref:ABC-type transport auxiliary lipoprotein component domain-containing protein n=2 Tax=Candidatus Schmidhempelia TaxID=1505768 RepID=A0AB94IEL3_9GAMM|nr:hypothetical protein O970_01505 [Candidatus Schmidhempelia bombi str. Bimp]
MMKKLVILLSLLLLTGCSSSLPEKHYYQIKSAYSVAHVETSTADNFIWIAPITIADFLNKDGLVYQTNDVEYHVANDNLWLSPLSEQLQNLVVHDLSALLPTRVISSSPMAAAKTSVNLFIEGFHGTYQGEAVLKGYWVIANANGQLYSKKFAYTLPVNKDGYGAIVETLSQAWQQEISDLVNKSKL